MPYETLYRRARPQTFDEVRGQEMVVRALRNQILKDRISHAYLFTGIRGTGKTTVARIFARAINCEHPVNGNPCTECDSCRRILSGSSNNVIEIDAAARGKIEDIRDIRDLSAVRPVHGKYTVFIIDETQMMKTAAVNAFLKTLEEPPSWVVFILATTDLKNMPQTIMSRCQEYAFRRMDMATITDRMRELLSADHIGAEEEALRYIAGLSEGSMRDALSLLDQTIAFTQEAEITYDDAVHALGYADVSEYLDMFSALIAGNAADSIRIFNRIVSGGVSVTGCLEALLGCMRDILMIRFQAADCVQADTETLKKMSGIAELLTTRELEDYIGLFDRALQKIRYSPSMHVLAEMALIRASDHKREEKRKDLLARLEVLEKRLSEAGAEVQDAEV